MARVRRQAHLGVVRADLHLDHDHPRLRVDPVAALQVVHHIPHHGAGYARTLRRVALLDDVVAVSGVACAEEVGLSTVGDGGLGVPVVGWVG